MSPFLEITTCLPRGGCSVACHFCPAELAADEYDKRGNGPRLMPLETFATCLAKMPSGTEVSFAGFAEPFLNNRCTDMAEECHRRGVPWQTYTTCVGMSLDDVKRIRAAKPTRIKIHLPDVEGYAKIRVDDAYVKVVEALADVPGASWMTMGTLHPAMVGRFSKVKAAPMHTRAGNVNAVELVKVRPPRKNGALRCRPGPELDRNILLPDGSLALCCFDFGQRHIIGNLMTQTWQEIRDGKPLAAIRAAMASEGDDVLCRTCEVSCAAGEKVKCA